MADITGLKEVKSIIAISSCKGGVGKSTVAALIAQELTQKGLKVGLLDVDMFGPSIPTLFHTNGPVEVQDNMYIPLESNGLKLMSYGFLVGDEPTVMRGPMISRYVSQLVHNTNWGDLDYLFIDFPPGTGDIQLTMTQEIKLDGAIIITTPQTLSLVDVARGILMFEKVNIPMLGIVENMAYFQCDNCDKKHYIFGEGSQTELEERFGLNVFAQIPLNHTFSNLSGTDPIIANMTNAITESLNTFNLSSFTSPEVEFNDKEITLRWTDSNIEVISNKDLRASCRCAACVDEYTGEVKFDHEMMRPDIQARNIRTLGNYALSVSWNDGHTSGIYPYKKIKKISKNL
ncbi:MAG: P-loop NTPase [bacterium]|nr:P-loop NTPase [bacterium]